MSKKCIAVLLALVLILSLSSVGFAAIKVRISVCNVATHPQNIGLEIFKNYVEEKTNGEMEVNVYPNSQLGAERESIEQCKNGSLEMATASAGPLATFNSKMMVLDIPFAFDSYDVAWMVLDGPVGQKLLESCEEVGLKGLSFMENGFRHVTSNVRPITKLEDFKNIKIRTMEAPMHMKNFKLLGANPTPVPWTELYLTIQQKIVDGQENPLANLWETKMYEVQKYVSLTGHIYDPMTLVADLKWFNNLTPKQQSIIEKGAILGQNYSRFVNNAREEELVRLLTEKGMVINDVSAEEKARMRDASQAKVLEAIKKNTDPAFIDEWLKAIEKAGEDIKAGL